MLPANVLKFILTYLLKVKVGFLSIVALILVGEIFFRLFIYYCSEVADVLASDMTKDEMLHQSLIYIIIALGYFLIHRIGYDVTTFVEARFLPVYLSKISKDLFSYTYRHSLAFFNEEMSGNIASKVKTMIDNSYNVYFNIVWGFVYPIFSVVTTLYFMYAINWELGAIMTIMVAIYMSFVIFVSKRVSVYSEKSARLFSEAQGVLVDSITNASLVKNFSSFLFERRNYFKAVRKKAHAEHDEIFQYGVLFIYQSICRTALVVIFCLLPLWYWYHGQITIGQFVLIQGLTQLLSNIFMHFSQTFMQFFRFYGGINDGLKLLSKPHEVTDVKGAKDLKLSKGAINYDDVTYHYKGSKPLFENFNLQIKAGEKIGLVGHSGSGKSTLVKILSRYYDLQKGKIIIDDQDISKVTQDSLRRNIALIPQDPSLFNRTIMENIRYGNLKATNEQVHKAAKKAYIHDFIMNLPDGYDSKVGERGVMLSGGERQRIAIARAILKNAPILILDEATSALDSDSERFIQESMQDLMKGKTVIAIAHRLSTLKEMDKIVVMSNGEIIETGSHASLIRKKGQYHKFYEMQSQGFLKL